MSTTIAPGNASVSSVRRAGILALATAVLVALGLALVPAAKAQSGLPTPAVPAITLGPITVGSGPNPLVSLTGTVGGDSLANVDLRINGQPVNLNSATGTFNAVVDLNGLSVIELKLGDNVITRIPLNLGGANGIIPANVLDALRNAGISLLSPAGGFTILDGNPLTVEGKVADKNALASLKVNGQDVLSLLKSDTSTPNNPNDATFSVPVSGSSREVLITATDKQGVSQTNTFVIERASSVINTEAGRSVSAAGAKGLRIFKVRYITKGVQKSKRIRMIVTLKDTRGFLVRGGIVRVRARDFNAKAIVGGQQAKVTGKVGTANFLLRVNPKSFTVKKRRLFTVAVAVTPTKSVKRNTSVYLPRLRRAGR